MDIARRILDRYRPQISCFNDDVQGTGCVTLAAIMAGLHVSKVDLKDMRVVIFGSGTAGTGIADQVRDAIAADGDISKEDAAKQIWYFPSLNPCILWYTDFLTKVCGQTWNTLEVSQGEIDYRTNPLRPRRQRLEK